MPKASVMPMEGLTTTPVEGSRGGFRSKWGKNGRQRGLEGRKETVGPTNGVFLEPCPHVGAKAEISTNWDETNCSAFFVCRSNSELYSSKAPGNVESERINIFYNNKSSNSF